jgi:hypothetical protein
MTNDDKVKLANEILVLDEGQVYFIPTGTYPEDADEPINLKGLQSIVSEWLQFGGESIGRCEHGSPRNLCEHCYWATVLKEVEDAKINQK